MSEQNTHIFEGLLKPLEEQLKKREPSYQQFEHFYEELNKVHLKFQELVEVACKITNDSREDFYKLQNKIARENVSTLIDKLQGLAYRYRNKNATLTEIFKDQIYRLLEQVRSGKRHEVFYGILRIFVSQREEFPYLLCTPFKPVYSEELFKVLMFSFLSSILDYKDESKEESTSVAGGENEFER